MAPAKIFLVEEDIHFMRTHINATATAKLSVDLSEHLDCFVGRGFEIKKSTADSMSLRFPIRTSIEEMRDAFAAGLIALLLKLPDSGASAALAKPIRVRVGGRRAAVETFDGLRRREQAWIRAVRRASRRALPLAA